MINGPSSDPFIVELILKDHFFKVYFLARMEARGEGGTYGGETRETRRPGQEPPKPQQRPSTLNPQLSNLSSQLSTRSPKTWRGVGVGSTHEGGTREIRHLGQAPSPDPYACHPKTSRPFIPSFPSFCYGQPPYTLCMGLVFSVGEITVQVLVKLEPHCRGPFNGCLPVVLPVPSQRVRDIPF